jgi:hypothetical protein
MLKAAWANFYFGSWKQCVGIFAKGTLFGLVILLADVAFPFAIAAIVLLLSFSANVVFHSPRNLAYRAISPDTHLCAAGLSDGWDILAAHGNDEWRVIQETGGSRWEQRFQCSLQRHVLLKYATPSGKAQPLAYDLAFVELQEDGQPHALIGENREAWTGEKHDEQPIGQLDSLLKHLDQRDPQYVVVFIHGWRHDASIGDGNVGDLRVYAAHAARFLADRCDLGDARYCKANVTAVFIGWRGARSDELWLTRHLGVIGSWIADFTAVFTLFDRKPVSEAIAPSALAAIRAIQDTLGMSKPVVNGLPPDNPNRLLILGHSLGGNMLAVALKDQVIKKVMRHTPGTYMLPPLGDLVVLINPASEAANWTAIQRAVWDRIPMATAERASLADFATGHNFFTPDQRPVLISITAARDWPPGGLRPVDCAWLERRGALTRLRESRQLGAEDIEYDSATYDAFPTFKGDLRPIANSIVRWAGHVSGAAPRIDPCQPVVSRNPIQLVGAGFAAALRVLPFMNTDAEQTHTIGHLDPPRAPRGTIHSNFVSGRPFGTTHEARASGSAQERAVRRTKQTNTGLQVESSLSYDEITAPAAACQQSKNWLTRARGEGAVSRTFWDSDAPQRPSRDSAEGLPALHFIHGFETAGLSAITRANDPFWNVRAFDTALARHDGYMLSSFICAINQFILDDITAFLPHTAASAVRGPQ